MRTGVILPTFRETPDEAFSAAEAAVEAGVDGLFCYDHLWPLGQPERPALAPFPILGALAGRFQVGRPPGDTPYLGTMVARVGLVPNSVLIAEFTALEHLAPGRVVAGLGTGDRLGAAENLAFGVPYPPASERRAAVVEVARALIGQGLDVWVAGGPSGRADEARATGAAVTLWDVRTGVHLLVRIRARPARGHLGRAGTGRPRRVAHRAGTSGSTLGRGGVAGRRGRARRSGARRLGGLVLGPPHLKIEGAAPGPERVRPNGCAGASVRVARFAGGRICGGCRWPGAARAGP